MLKILLLFLVISYLVGIIRQRNSFFEVLIVYILYLRMLIQYFPIVSKINNMQVVSFNCKELEYVGEWCTPVIPHRTFIRTARLAYTHSGCNACVELIHFSESCVVKLLQTKRRDAGSGSMYAVLALARCNHDHISFF